MQRPFYPVLLAIFFCGHASAADSPAFIVQYCMQNAGSAPLPPYETIAKPRQLSGIEAEIAAQILSKDNIKKIGPEQFGLEARSGENHYIFRGGVFAGVENVIRTIGKDSVLYFSAGILGRAGTAQPAFFLLSSASELSAVQCRMSAAM